jgi:hypothetical protein
MKKETLGWVMLTVIAILLMPVIVHFPQQVDQSCVRTGYTVDYCTHAALWPWLIMAAAFVVASLVLYRKVFKR